MTSLESLFFRILVLSLGLQRHQSAWVHEKECRKTTTHFWSVFAPAAGTIFFDIRDAKSLTAFSRCFSRIRGLPMNRNHSAFAG